MSFLRYPAVWLVVIGAIVGISCSSGPAAPQPGTPGYFWAGANLTYKAGDFVKTTDNLQRLLTLESEFHARARVWDIVVSSGLAQGYAEFADAYEAGAKMNRQNPAPFRKEVRELRSQAVTYAVQLTEDIHQFMALTKEDQVLLAFGYPAGSTAEPPALKRIAGGILVQDSEREQALQAMLQRGVLMSVCRVVGTPDDAAKAQEILKAPEVKVPRDTFLMAAARALDAQTDLFGSNKMDQPNRAKVMLGQAQEALEGVAESKESKKLKEKIDGALKKLTPKT